MFSQLQSKAGSVWCNLMHESIMWPTHSHYECRTCGRRYPAFAEAEMMDQPARSDISLRAKTPRTAARLSRA
jgi:hypothetical protein